MQHAMHEGNDFMEVAVDLPKQMLFMHDVMRSP